MTFLAFIIATGLYLTLGPGGPLHSDNWFLALRRRVDAIEPDLWLGFILMVVVPCAALALVYAMLEELFGGAAMLIIGTAALFFSFGRADFTSLIERFLSRCNVGDFEGGALLLEQAGADIEAEDVQAFGRLAARTFLYEGFQRWFPAAFYFLLLGPFAAVAYRLIQLSADDQRVPVGSLRHLADWLPSRLLLITLALVGNFEATRPVITQRALDPEIETDELFLLAVESSLMASNSDPEHRISPGAWVGQVQELLKRAMVVWLVTVSVVVIVAG